MPLLTFAKKRYCSLVGNRTLQSTYPAIREFHPSVNPRCLRKILCSYNACRTIASAATNGSADVTYNGILIPYRRISLILVGRSNGVTNAWLFVLRVTIAFPEKFTFRVIAESAWRTRKEWSHSRGTEVMLLTRAWWSWAFRSWGAFTGRPFTWCAVAFISSLLTDFVSFYIWWRR